MEVVSTTPAPSASYAFTRSCISLRSAGAESPRRQSMSGGDGSGGEGEGGGGEGGGGGGEGGGGEAGVEQYAIFCCFELQPSRGILSSYVTVVETPPSYEHAHARTP